MFSSAPCTCSTHACATKYGPLHEPIFLAHAFLLALFIAKLHAVWVLSCIKGAAMTCLHPFHGLIEAAQCTWMHGQHALRFMHVEAILHHPCSHWSVIAVEDCVLGSGQISNILCCFTASLDQPCLGNAMPLWHHVFLASCTLTG